MKIVKSVLLVFSVTLSSITFASYTCSGPVVGVALEPSTGRLFAQSIAGISWPMLCGVDQMMNGVPVEVCKGIYSMLLSAQVAGKEVTLWFNDSGDCQSHPGWVDLTGWYFGPQING